MIGRRAKACRVRPLAGVRRTFAGGFWIAHSDTACRHYHNLVVALDYAQDVKNGADNGLPGLRAKRLSRLDVASRRAGSASRRRRGLLFLRSPRDGCEKDEHMNEIAIRATRAEDIDDLAALGAWGWPEGAQPCRIYAAESWP